MAYYGTYAEGSAPSGVFSEPRNATFSYASRVANVWVTKFWYSWTLLTKSSSISRLAQTTYPFRAVQGELNVEMIFTSGRDYIQFCNFARDYHQAVANGSGKLGGSVPELVFSCGSIPAVTSQLDGRGDAGGIEYSVAIPTVPVKVSYDAVAPTMTLSMPILSGNEMMGGASSSYSLNGSMSDYIGTLPTSGDVKARGDNAYTRTQSRKAKADAQKGYMVGKAADVMGSIASKVGQ